jgi:hypothetical protein
LSSALPPTLMVAHAGPRRRQRSQAVVSGRQTAPELTVRARSVPLGAPLGEDSALFAGTFESWRARGDGEADAGATRPGSRP